MGKEGQNYWVSRGGRCRLTAPEHLRPSGPDETGEFLALNGVKRELEQLLDKDFDGEDAYDGEEENNVEDLDDIGSLYSPSVNPDDDRDKELFGDHDILDEEGDAILEHAGDDDEDQAAEGDSKNLERSLQQKKKRRFTLFQSIQHFSKNPKICFPQISAEKCAPHPKSSCIFYRSALVLMKFLQTHRIFFHICNRAAAFMHIWSIK